MKKLLFSIFLLFISGTAIASEWGCQVVLCLSNPGGPTQFKECVKPIEKLWESLAKGKPFPTCEEGGISMSKIGYEPYEACPADFYLTNITTHEEYKDHGRVLHTAVCRHRTQTVKVACDWDDKGGVNRVCEIPYDTPARLRDKPNYIDISYNGGSFRTWFKMGK